MKWKKFLLCCLALLFVIVAGCAEAADDFSDVKAELRIGSAGLGSTNQVLLTGVASIVSKYLPTLRCSSITTAGATENLRLLAQKELEIGSINGDAAYAALKGTGIFKSPIIHFQMFSMHNNQCVFVTLKGSGIEKIEDLEGKRVSVGPAGSGTWDLAYSVLVYGYDLWDKMEKVYLSLNDQTEALKDGTIDAMVAHLNCDYPAAYFAELDATVNNLHIMGESEEALKKIQAEQPFQKIEVLKPGGYLANLDREILVMTNYASMYARKDIPEKVIYAFVKTLFDHCTELDAYHRQGQNIRPELASRGLFAEIPVHPGAAKYLKEIGQWNDAWVVGEIQR
jgi:TRAP transporter TAXI family solute receptor